MEYETKIVRTRCEAGEASGSNAISQFNLFYGTHICVATAVTANAVTYNCNLWTIGIDGQRMVVMAAS